MDCLKELSGTAVAPGDRICRADDTLIAGWGTHEYHNWIHASMLGRVELERNEEATLEDAEKKKQHQPEAITATKSKTTVRVISPNLTFPSSIINAIVIAQVVRVTSRVAQCTLLMCNRVQLHPGFKGQIRREDVRATERDRVDLAECFRAGDFVQARVLTLGQNGTYLLSTAQNELGVVFATGVNGSQLTPISWSEMQCPLSGQIYKRKVAKVPEEFMSLLINLAKQYASETSSSD